jgi:signal transduction histidine kinase
MAGELIDDVKRFLGFEADDAEALAGLLVPLSPKLPEVVDSMFEAILRHPGAQAVLNGGPEQSRRLRQTLLAWLGDMFCGTYDGRYYEQRCEIGRVHIRVGLPQQYMFTAMNVVRLALVERIEALGLKEERKKIAAVHKILDLELAIMNDTYREDLVRQVEEVQHAKFEQRLSESEHLATVGRLAASLAHEIKNPLAGISGAIQILGAGLEAEHPHKEIISEALRQIDRLDAAVKDLLVYARPKPPSMLRVDLNQLLERVLMLFRQEPAFREVRVHCEGLNEEHEILVDEVQIQQVLSNLMINAAHACEQGGDVSCRISRLESSIRFVIEDNGTGIKPEVLPRVFEPFFTTKSRGTGLGLPICQRIVEAHGGTIEITSEVGKGTLVSIDIPSHS